MKTERLDTAASAGHHIRDRVDENLNRHELSFCNNTEKNHYE